MTQKYSYSMVDFYQQYEGTVSRSQYREIITLYCDLIFEKLLTGYDVRLPDLGYISLKKMKGKAINWQTTNEFFSDHNAENDDKKRIYERNEHTDGWIAFLKWDNKTHPIPRKSFFKFNLSRKYKRKLAKLLKDNPELMGNFNQI